MTHRRRKPRQKSRRRPRKIRVRGRTLVWSKKYRGYVVPQEVAEYKAQMRGPKEWRHQAWPPTVWRFKRKKKLFHYRRRPRHWKLRERPHGKGKNTKFRRTKHAIKWIVGLAVLGVIVGGVVTYAPQIQEFIEKISARAEFQVSNLTISPSEVESGGSVMISVDLINVGDEEGTYVVELKIDGFIEETKSITLGEGEHSTISFDVCREVEGSYLVEVENLSQEFEVTILPPNYYEIAENYVIGNYAFVGEEDIGNLFSFLDQLQFPEYSGNYFDCSEASAMLEWLLEGAGFNASIATNVTSAYVIGGHTWVLVTLNNGDVVAIESTSLTQNYYAPPGIIEAPNGQFREYTYDYRLFLEWKEKYPPSLYAYDPNITFDEWKRQYLMQPIQQIGIPTREGYYNPPKTYNSPEEAITVHDGYFIPKTEFDWWNVSPYSNMEPFSGWN